jgi:hypothetical protein
MSAGVRQAINDIPNPVKYQVTYHDNDDPQNPGRWGVYEPSQHAVYIGASAHAAGLPTVRYTVAHETGHAYYWQVFDDGQRFNVAVTMALLGAANPEEGFADCVSVLWNMGAVYEYWRCPDLALAYVRSVVL